MAKKKKDILIPTEANIVQPYFLTQEEIDRTPSSNVLDIDYSKYKDYLGNNGQPVSISPEHWDEQRAKRQSGFAKFGNSLGQGLGTFGTAVASTVGVLGGLAYAPFHAMEEGDQDNLGDIFANPVVKGIADFDKYLKEDVFPTYYTKEQQDSIFSAATGTDLINGIGFLASALVPNAVVQKVFGGLSKAVQASRLGTFTATLDEAIAAGTISTEEAAKLGSLVGAINKTGEVTGAVIGRLGESAIEANDSYDTVKASLIAARNKAKYELDAYGETDDPDAANLTDADIEAQAKSQRDNVFGGNMLLSLSDFNQTMRWFGKGTSIGDDIVKQGLKYTAKKEGALGLAGKILKEGIQEAGEEGYQFVLQKAAEKARDFDGFSNAIGAATDDLFSTTEGIKSMLLGAVLGGGASAGFDAINKKDKIKSINDLVDNLNSNPGFANRYTIDENGKKIVNPELAKGNDKFIFYEALKQKALEDNDIDTFNLLEKKQFAELVSSRQQAGKLEDLINELQEVGKMSKEEVKAIVGNLPVNPITGQEMTPSEIASSKIAEAKRLAKTVDGINSIKEFSRLSAAGKSHIASLLVEQDILKEEYKDLEKKVNELAASPIMVTPKVVPSSTIKAPKEFGLKDVEIPDGPATPYAALDEKRALELRKKTKQVEERYAEINDQLKKYLEAPSQVEQKVQEDKKKDDQKAETKAEDKVKLEKEEESVISQLSKKAEEEKETSQRYKVVTETGETFYPVQTKEGKTVLVDKNGKRPSSLKDAQIVDVDENEDEEIEFKDFQEKPWNFKKTTILTSAGTNSTYIKREDGSVEMFNNLGDRRNLFLSPGRKLFYEALDSVKGKLSMKIEIAPIEMYDELFVDAEGNKVPHSNRPVYIGYLYRDGKPVEKNGVRAYNVLHDPESLDENRFAIENFEEDKEEYIDFIESVKEALTNNQDVFVTVTEISSGFVNITKEPKPLKEIVNSPAITSGGVQIAVSMISNLTGRPVIVEEGKEVQEVKWSGRPYIRVKVGDGTNGPKYQYVELNTRLLNEQEVNNIIIPLIIEYINGNDFIKNGEEEIPILSYDSSKVSILDNFIAFIRSGNPDTSIYFGKGPEARTLYFGNSESGKIRLSKNNMENIELLREFLLNKKRTVNRKYTINGRLKPTTKVTIPIITASGIEFKTLTYLELLSGEQGFEAGLTSNISPDGTVLNKYAVFEPKIESKPNTTVSVKRRASKKPVEEKEIKQESDVKEPVNLNQPINRLLLFTLSSEDSDVYSKNMIAQNNFSALGGLEVPEFEDLIGAFRQHQISNQNLETGEIFAKSFIDFAKDFLTPERFEEMKKYIQPTKPVFGKKEKPVKSTLFFKPSDKNLRVGSYVSYKDRKYIVYSVNGSILLLTDGKTPIEVKTKDVTVEGGYAIGKYGKSNFIVVDSKKVISTVTGKQVFQNAKTKSAKTKKVRTSLSKILFSAKAYFKKQVPEFKDSAPKEPESLFKPDIAGSSVIEVAPELIIKKNEGPILDSEGNEILEDNISDKEYEVFIDTGKVSEKRIDSIALKIKNNEQLSEREIAFFNEKTSQINEKLIELRKKDIVPAGSSVKNTEVDFRVATNLPYKQGDIESAKKWLQEKLGVTPEVVEGLIQVSSHDFGLFGRFYNGVITLSDILEEGTEYHEAFHLVSRMYLSDQEVKALYKEAEEKAGRKLSEREAEEMLAEDFRDYVMSNGKIKYPEVKRSIFKKILDAIKALLGMKPVTVNEIFAKINAGFYNKTSYVKGSSRQSYARDAGNILSPSEKYKINQVLLALFRDYLNNNGIPFYKLSLNDDLPGFENLAKQHFAQFNSAFNTNPKYFLDEFKNNVLAEADIIETEEEDKGREEGNKELQESAKVSGFFGLSDRMKFLFSTIVDVTSEPNEYNSMAIVPASEVKAFLAYICHDKFTLSEIMDAIRDYASIEPKNYVEERNKHIALQIGKSIGRSDINNIDQVLFRQEFFNAVTLVKQDMLMSLHYKPYGSNVGDVAIINTHEKKIKDRILEYLQGRVLGSKYVTNTQGQKHIQPHIWRELVKKTPKEFLDAFGIEIRNPDLLDEKSVLYSTIKSFINKLDTFPMKEITILNEKGKETVQASRTASFFYLEDYISSDINLKQLRGTWRTLVNEIVNREVEYYNQTTESQARNTEGESVYGYTKPSYLYQKLAEIKQGMIQYTLTKGSKLWESITNNRVSIVLVDGERFNETGEEGITSSKMTKEDLLLNRISNLYGRYKDNIKRPVVTMLQMADKKSVYGLELKDSSLIVTPKEIKIKDGKIILEANDELVKRVWNIYQNFVEFDKNKNENFDRYKTFGSNASYFEDYNGGKPISREEFHNVLSNILTLAAYETEPYSRRLIGNKEGSDICIIPDEILKLAEGNASQKLQQIIAGLVATEFVTNLEQMSIFFGPPNLYKALFKRTPEVRANGRIASIDADIDEFIERSRKDYGWTDEQLAALPPVTHHFKGAVFKDIETSAKYAEEYKKVLNDDRYGKVNATDGQGMVTFEFYREYSIRTGQWTAQAEEAFWKELKGIQTNYPFPPMKLVHYGEEQDALSKGEFIPVYYKFSVYPLIPSLIKGRKLEKVRQDLINSGSSLGIFDSGNKVGNLKEIGVFGEGINQNATHLLNVKDLKIQVDINAKKDKYELLIGTQLRKLIIQNIADAGRDVKNPEDLQEFIDTVKELANIEVENLAESLGITSDELKAGNLTHDAWGKLIDIFKEAAIEKQESDNVIASFDYLKDQSLTIDVLPTRDKVQNMMNALINSRILRQKMRGRPYVQCSSVGYEYYTEEALQQAVKDGVILEDSEFYRSHFVEGVFNSTNARLGFLKKEDDKVITAEILLPYMFKDKVDIKNIDPKLLEALGYRIPTQGLNSMLMFKVVGFLPANVDQLAAVPYEITMQGGSDFDVDKLNTFLREYFYDKKTKNIKAITLTPKEYYDAKLKSLKSFIALLDSKVSKEYEKLFSSIGKDEQVDKLLAAVFGELSVEGEFTEEEIKDIIEEAGFKRDSFDKALNKLKEMSEDPEKFLRKYKKAYTSEKLFSIMAKRLQDPDRFFDYINPNSADELETDANYINSLQTKDYKLTVDYKGLKQFFTSSNIEVGKNFWSAKDGVGQAASQGTFTSLTQTNPIVQGRYSDRLFVPDNTVNKDEEGRILFGKLNNTDGKSIIDIIANQHLSANVDAASKPFIFMLNANGVTNDTHYYLETAGVPVKWVNRFMTQPIIYDYVRMMEEKNSIVSKKRRLIFNERTSEKDVIEAIIKKYGGDISYSEYYEALNKDKKDSDGLHIPSALSDGRKYTIEDLEKFMQDPKKYAKEQINILDDFLFYKEWAAERRNVISSVKFDTQGAGKNLPESRIMEFKYDKLENKSFYLGVTQLVDNSILGTFRDNVLKLALALYGGTTIVEKNSATNYVLNEAMKKLDSVRQLKPESLFKIYGMLTNIILQNGLIKPEQREQWWKENMIGNNSIANQIAALINSEEMKDNYLFSNLLQVEFSNKPDEPDIIKFDNSVRIETNLEQVIQESFVDFKSKYPFLYEKMIMMSLFQTGVIQSPVSFYKYLPVDDFVTMVKPILQSTAINEGSTVDVMRELVKNMYGVRGIVQKVNSNDITSNRNGTPDYINLPNNEKYKNEMFLLKTTKDSVALYEQTDVLNKGNLVFMKTPLKSTSKFYNGLIGTNFSVNVTEDVDAEDVTFTSTTSYKNLTFKEEQSSGYKERTIKNASADATIAIAVDFESAGEKLTKSSVLGQGKQYVDIPFEDILKDDENFAKTVFSIVNDLNEVNAKTLNIAGNGIYTFKGKYKQEQIDKVVYDLLKAVIESPDLKNKIQSVRTGGQTGVDEAGAKAAVKLGIPTLILSPKGWLFRNESGQDISDERQFKERFEEFNLGSLQTVTAIKLKDGTLISLDDISISKLIELGYTREDAQELFKKHCLGL